MATLAILTVTSGDRHDPLSGGTIDALEPPNATDEPPVQPNLTDLGTAERFEHRSATTASKNRSKRQLARVAPQRTPEDTP
ncbi:hypothetical protein CV102_10075 [Natronococcus pandeyae]|uniref:Uncharacterized protein n=1 Tax=Natronococcus pandeyae TaxID=2055836 RepID=A0A8J8Q5G1_9EURY|nr:hypothetical protein CV102_10075 [Natronococcus pandeyae]